VPSKKRRFFSIRLLRFAEDKEDAGISNRFISIRILPWQAGLSFGCRLFVGPASVTAIITQTANPMITQS